MKKIREARVYENEYCPIYDTYYKKTGEWCEGKCGDEECIYCLHRPPKHSKHCSCLKEDGPKDLKEILKEYDL